MSVTVRGIASLMSAAHLVPQFCCNELDFTYYNAFTSADELDQSA